MQAHTIDRPVHIRPRARRLAAGLIAALATAAMPVADARSAACPGAVQPPSATSPEQAASAVVCVVNRERARRDRRPLRERAALAVAARRYARDMVRRGFFSHTAPGGASLRDRLRDVGYLRDVSAWTVGETLAWGWGTRATPAATVAAWLASPPHRHVLLDPRYREIGIGATTGVPVDLGVMGLPEATYAAELGVRS